MKIILINIFLLVCLKVQAQKDSTKIFLKAKGTLSYPIADSLIKEVVDVNQMIVCLDIVAIGPAEVKAIYEGTVSSVTKIENMFVVIIRFGNYFFTYSQLKDVTVTRYDYVKQGTVLGKVIDDEDSGCHLDIILSTKNGNIKPLPWFKKNDRIVLKKVNRGCINFE